MNKQTEPDTTNDMELIRNYLNGNTVSFNKLYEKYRSILYGYIRKLTYDSGIEADEVFQMTWIKAISKLDKYREQDKFSAWLMKIASNLFIDLCRTRKSRNEVSLDDELEMMIPDKSAERPDSPLQCKELKEAYHNALSKMSPSQRMVFLLRKQNVPFAEIAKIQNCNISTCLTRMRYALNFLKQSLANWI